MAFPSLARESLVLRPEGRLNLTAATAGGATHRPAVRRPDPSVLLAGTPTRISRSSRVGPSGQLFTVGAHGVTVKATFPLARRICAAPDGWNYLHGISGDEARLAPTMPLSEVEPMVDRADPTGHAPELARSVTLATARRRTALAAVARPAGQVAGLLLVEFLCSPRARAAALGLARSLARWLAGRRPPASARAEVTTRRVTVGKDAGTSVLVHRVETALVVRTRKWPALGPQTISNARAARANSGNEPPARQPRPAGRRTSGDRPESSLKATVPRLTIRASGRGHARPSVSYLQPCLAPDRSQGVVDGAPTCAAGVGG